MIGHIFAKLYGVVLEMELSNNLEASNLQALEQVGFSDKLFSTIDYIFTPRCLIDHTKACKQILYCCFVDFYKAFNTIPREKLFDKLRILVIDYMIWVIYTLYE
jgi:hypothetical protein